SCSHPLLHPFPTRRSSDLSLIVAVVAPWGITAPPIVALAIWLGKLAMLGLILACVETAFAKLRILRLPDLLASAFVLGGLSLVRSEEHTSELQSRFDLVCR